MRTKSSKILAVWGTLAILGAHSLEAFHSAYAEEREDEERGESRERERENRENEREDDERRSAPSAPSTTPTTTPSAPVATAPSTGTTRSCTTVYDTVTNASGTQSQVPRQVCTDVPAGNSTTPAVPATPAPVPAPVPVPTPAPVQIVKPVVVSALKDGTYSWVGTYSYPGGGIDYVVEIAVSGGKISKAGFLNFTPSGNGLYTRAKGDTELQRIVANQNAAVDVVTGASGTSNAVQTAVNQALAKARGETVAQVPKITAAPEKTVTTQSAETTATGASTYIGRAVRYVAPNGKSFIVYPDPSRGGKFTFKRADGSVSDKTFADRSEVVVFLKNNNPSVRVASTTVANAAPAAWKVSGKKKMRSVHVFGKTRGQVMAEAQRIANERAAAKAGGKAVTSKPAATVAKPKAPTPAPVVSAPAAAKPPVSAPVAVPTPAKTPAADTTTKAS